MLPRVTELHDYHTGSSNTMSSTIGCEVRSQCRLLSVHVDRFLSAGFCSIYDYWGRPKAEGIGGGLRRSEESNQPVGIFLETKYAGGSLCRQ
jgi:hypothetical protein